MDQQLIGVCPLVTVPQWIWHSCHKRMFLSDVKRAALGLKVLNKSESTKGLSEIAQSSATLKLGGHDYLPLHGFSRMFLGSALLSSTQWSDLWPTLGWVYLHDMEFGCGRWLEESQREILPGNPEHWICYSDLELSPVLPQMCLTAMKRWVICHPPRLISLNDTQ